MKRSINILFLFSGMIVTINAYCQENDHAGIGLVGDPADVRTSTKPGIVLMGGSTDVDEAFRWMIELSGGGDFVIIRASGATGYNDYVMEMGKVNSVETLLVDSREKAMNPKVGDRLREAEAVFIAGGDQANYVNFWTNSEISSAFRYLIDEKKIPIGGTSAGCAVLTDVIFDASHDTAISKEALANPYHETVSLSRSFIRLPILEGVIADQHYAQREREGRHVTFMARMSRDFGIEQPRGIGVNEKTAVCIDQDGNAKVYGSGKAFFIRATGGGPETCSVGKPLTWSNDHHAMDVFIFPATAAGTPAFNLAKWPDGKGDEIWYVENGKLERTTQ